MESRPAQISDSAASFKQDNTATEYRKRSLQAAEATREGERKQVTVLFADLKDSLEMVAESDAEEARNLLDSVVALLIDAVHRYEGTVSKVLGDGIMAIFGAPLAFEDHAVRACNAASYMQTAARKFSTERRATRSDNVQIRIGLNSGEAVVRTIDSDLSLDYSAIGKVTHIAARLEQLAKPGTILATSTTVNLAGNQIASRSLGKVNVKGLKDPLEIFEVWAEASKPKRFNRITPQKLDDFVGRQIELEILKNALSKAESHSGQVVVLVGEPGIGKSRLVWELCQSPIVDGWAIFESAATPLGKSVPYLPIIDLFRSYFEIEDDDDSAAIEHKIVEKVKSSATMSPDSLPVFLTLFGIEVSDGAWLGMQPAERRERSIETLSTVLLRESRLRKLIIILEDMQWIDRQSEAVINRLVDSLPACPCSLILTARPEFKLSWTQKTYFTRVPVGALPLADAENFIDLILGSDSSLNGVKDFLKQRTGGNPFFIEESIRSLADSGILKGTRGAYTLTRIVERWPVPSSVYAVLAERIDRLEPNDKRVLQAAAVIGTQFTKEILKRVTGLDAPTLDATLSRLQSVEMIYELMASPAREYAFKHPLTHEVTLSSLLQSQKKALHGKVVDAIEQVWPDTLSERVDMLAHHALESENLEKALDYLRQASERALARSANVEALDYIETALSALDRLPKTKEFLEKGVDVRFEFRAAAIPLGERERLITRLNEAESIAKSLDDAARLGRVYAYLTQYHWLYGDWQRAIKAGRQALSVGAALGDMATEVATKNYLGLAHYSLGDYETAATYFKANTETLSDSLAQRRFGLAGLPAVVARSWLAWTLSEQGKFDDALGFAQEGVRIAEIGNQPFDRVQANLGLAGAYLRRGDFEVALPYLRQSLEQCETSNIRLLLARVLSGLATAYVYMERANEAVAFSRRALGEESALGMTAVRSFIYLRHAEICFLAGMGDEAKDYAERTWERSEKYKEVGIKAWLLKLRGNLQEINGNSFSAAQDYYKNALSLSERLGMRPLVGLSHLSLARNYEKAGDLDQAKISFENAKRIFDELGMAYWSKAVSALRQ